MPHEGHAKLVSMKIDPKAREEKFAETVSADRPSYPYGLAKVDVTSVSENERTEGGKPTTQRSVGLQITDLFLEPMSTRKAADETLYET
jgi:hypothetical protein